MKGIMGKNFKLLAIVSLAAIMTTGCSRLGGGSSSSGGYSSGGSTGQVARTGQVRSGGGLFGQRRTKSTSAATCAPCAAGSGSSTASTGSYTYKPAAKPVYTAPKPAKSAGQHNQQYYIDRWNRQQSQQRARPRQNTRRQQPQQNTQNYAGYGNGGYNANASAGNTTYYDYSTAGKTATAAPAATKNVSASNKSIYTGSYQKPTYKPYQPTTYAGGSAGTTSTTDTYASAKASIATGSRSGGTYTVKKGDTVFEVMRQTGVYWKDIISMNNLVKPYTISPGQTLRLK